MAFPASSVEASTYGPDPAIPVFLRVPPRVWIASLWPVTADPIHNIHIRQFRGKRPLPLVNTSGNSGAHARFHQRTRLAIPGHTPVVVSSTSGNPGGCARCRQRTHPAIPGHAPVVVSSTSGNPGACASCHQRTRPAISGRTPVVVSFHIWQSRGTRPLLPAPCPAIPGRAPVVVSLPSGNSGASARCRLSSCYLYR